MNNNRAVEILHVDCKKGWSFFYDVGGEHYQTRIFNKREDCEKIGKKEAKLAISQHIKQIAK